MFDIRGHRASDSFVNAQHATTTAVRYAVLTLIIFSIVVWVWNRPWSASSEAIVSPDRILAIMVGAGLQPTSYFEERFTGLEGIEVARPGCPRSMAILPVAFGNLELPPDALSYRWEDYDVAYAFDGDLYSTRWASYRLRIVAIWRRLASLVTNSTHRPLSYYFKIWTPRGCKGLMHIEAERLRNAD
jgi:hypothetical protein